MGYILDHHPALRAQRESNATAKMLNRLPIIETLIGERRQAAANVEMAEANAARARESAAEIATIRRLDLLIKSQRRQIAHLAGDRWEWLYRDLSRAALLHNSITY